jgi:hypothetical protein
MRETLLAIIVTFGSVSCFDGSSDPTSIDSKSDSKGDLGGKPSGSEPLSQDAERVITEFMACMTLENFHAADMAHAWGSLEAQNTMECDNCHATGGFGFFANIIESEFFAALLTNRDVWLQYFTLDLTKGPANAKVIPNISFFEGVGDGKDPHREHPRFDGEPGYTALRDFYDRTMAAKAEGRCPTL